MTELKGTKTEVKEVVIKVNDKELMRAIRERTNVGRNTLNDEKNEIGYWSCDDGGGYFEHESDTWTCVSTDKKSIEVLKAIKIVEAYLEKEK